MVKKIFNIVLKNFKVLFRSKSSSLVVILGPLLLVFLLGISFNNTSSYFVNVGIYSQEHNNLTDSIISGLNENEFRTFDYGSLDDCILSVKDDNTQVCIEFSGDFTVGANKSTVVIFNVDYSDINLVWVILDVMRQQVNLESSKISKGLSGNLLKKLSDTQGYLKNQSRVIVRLKSNENAVKAHIDSISEDVSSMDISMNSDEFDFDKLTKIREANDENLDSLKSDAFKLADEIEDLVDDMTDAISDIDDATASNISDEIDAALDLLNKSAEKTIDLKASLEKTYNSSIGDADTLRETIADVKSQVNDLGNKLSAAQSKKTNIVKSLDDAKDKVDDSLKIIGELESIIDKINSNIDDIDIKDAAKIASPITTEIKPITKMGSHFYNLFPTLLVLIIMFTAVLLSSTFIMVEKKSKAFLRNFLSPTSHFTFNIGLYITSLIVVFLQACIFVAIAVFYFGIDISNLTKLSYLFLGIILFIVMSIFIWIGMLIGYLFRTEETNILASITVSTLLIFFSNTVLPLQTLPVYIRQIAEYNPFVISVNLIKKVLVYNLAFESIKYELYLMVGFTFGLFLVLLAMQSLFRKMMFMGKSRKTTIDKHTNDWKKKKLSKQTHKASESSELKSLVKEFVKDKKGYWSHNDWKSLLKFAKEKGISVDEGVLADILSKEKDSYFKIDK